MTRKSLKKCLEESLAEEISKKAEALKKQRRELQSTKNVILDIGRVNPRKASYIVNIHSYLVDGRVIDLEHFGSLPEAIRAAEAAYRKLNHMRKVGEDADYRVRIQLGFHRLLVPEEYWEGYRETKKIS